MPRRDPPNGDLLHSRASGAGVRYAGKPHPGMGRTRRRLRLARQRTRQVRRLQRQCLDRGRQARRQPDPEIHARMENSCCRSAITGRAREATIPRILGKAAALVVYQKTNEVFVADGYGNRRVIVYDADTGAYKRHWGAYGNKPDDKASNARTFEAAGRRQFQPAAWNRAISNDFDLVYVSAIEITTVFKCSLRRHVREGRDLSRGIRARNSAPRSMSHSRPINSRSSFNVPDGSNVKVQILNRQTLGVVGWFGGHGGRGLFDFYRVHNIASDSKGNIYLGEGVGQRFYKWSYKACDRAGRGRQPWIRTRPATGDLRAPRLA